MATHALFETASGYAIFKVNFKEEIGSRSKAVQDSVDDFPKFGKMVSLVSFSPFKSAAHALENANDVSEGVVNDYLRSLLELNLSKPSKGSSVVLAVSDTVLAGSIKAELNIQCDASRSSLDVLRGIRQHAPKLLKGMQADDLIKAQLGLGHSFSRAKLKFNVNRVDNMIIQAVALLDQLDKDVNLFSMRVREWYGYHFPELAKLVPDNYLYAKVVQFIGPKETLNEDRIPDLASLLEDDTTKAQNVLDAARGSMGASLSEIDMLNISSFAIRVVSLADYRKSLSSYLYEKMSLVAPSLTALLGERIGARLISHAGSLTNLSKYPASTVQILGAEKALFRALKTKGNTPKYGLLYHSSFIGRAGPKHKGRISRFLANKCSIASRIDCFSDKPSVKFGEALREQVEERLKFFETGEPPSKNAEAIRKVIEAIALEEADEEGSDEDEDEMKVDDSPRKDAAGFPILPLIEVSPPVELSPRKKSKKRKGDDMDTDRTEEEEEEVPRKKVKLSKEEKRALKKELKRKRKEEEKAASESPKKAEKIEKIEKIEKKEKRKEKSEVTEIPDGTTAEKPGKHKKEKKEKKEKRKRNKESTS